MVNTADTELIASYVIRGCISLAIVITGCIMLSRDSNTALWSGLVGTVLGLWFPNVSSGITTTLQNLIRPPQAVVIPYPQEAVIHQGPQDVPPPLAPIHAPQ